MPIMYKWDYVFKISKTQVKYWRTRTKY